MYYILEENNLRLFERSELERNTSASLAWSRVERWPKFDSPRFFFPLISPRTI